ncbi:M24 family metallopeptidase [Desulfobacula toluolica]|uniref:Predicted Xaa-Pro dipeptidase n=1 Tax=Desulfobacula toluolica (strain DSM 7467 / Tol2) TaxID=651182 RepID=K0NLB3_DESTT|nr:Xaa-Pro peptidase family protein [Desulfobacula toluolica]CCK82366.1 predicted Xaa-Pro dipeptidase [Desulfobacula toluolica Tol2]
MELVPKSQIYARIKKFQKWLTSKDLDGAFVLQNVDLYYLSGTLQRAILFVPCEGQPLLMVIKSFQRARNESAIQAIFEIQGRGGILPILAGHGHGMLKRVGFELDVLPTAQYLWFQKKFPRIDFVDISPGIRKLRTIKTPYEVNQIQRATAILDKGYQEIQQLIREGMTELEIDGLLYCLARKEGHMGIMRMRGWNQEMTHAHVLSGESGAVVSSGETTAGGPGNTPAMPQGAGFGRVKKNEPIYIDYGVGVNGYFSDQTRTLVMGDLEDDLARAYECSKKILETLEAEVQPGIPCARLYERAHSIARKNGFEENFMGYGQGKVKFVGHGIGLEIDELPVMAPGFKAPIQEGMVFALEPKFVFPGKGIVGIEDDYRVTSKGIERLTLTDQALIRIS